jgi:TRAP transporter 4TM/12TM fusion protein
MGTAEKVLAPKYRVPPAALRVASLMLPVIAIIFTLIYVFHLTPFGWAILDFAYLCLLIALLLPLIFIWTPIAKGVDKNKVPWYDILLSCLAFGIPLYFFFIAYEIVSDWGVIAPVKAIVLSVILWAILIEAARRSVNILFAGIVLFFSVYPLFSFVMPGPLWAPVTSNFTELAAYHILGLNSLMGIVMQVFGRLLLGFFIFAVAIQLAGAGQFFSAIAIILLGKTRAGHAKTAILGSGFLGSVTGSSLANVMTTGAFTIPAMKRSGLPPHLAAAVEACASTGGALMPPIMGTVAFLMAEFLEISYAEVCKAAIVPSVLYYLVLFVQIDLYAGRVRLPAHEDGTDPATTSSKIWPLFVDYLHIILSVFVLIYMLFWMRLEAYAPWIATAVLFALAMLRKKTRLSARQFLYFFENSGRVLGDLIGVLAPLGFIIGSFTLTGIAYSLPYEIVKLAHGNLYVLLAVGALASFILGMGVSIAACYIFLAIVLAPGLVQGGIDPVAAHLFVLYCGLWSFITPPVALAAFTAAGIAGADSMRTGLTAMRLGMAKYLLPFFFVISPAMILRESTLLEALRVVGPCALGLILMSIALEGYAWGIGKISIPTRVLTFFSGFLIAYPELWSNIVGIIIGAVMFGGLLVKRKVKH